MLTRLRNVAATSLIALTPLVSSFIVPGIAHAATGTYYEWTGGATATAGLAGCTSNCWSVAGNWKVSNDGGVTYVAATTAPLSTDNSGAGDNLVFDNTALSANTTLTDDIASLKVANIATVGSASTFFYSVGGQALNVTAGTAGRVGSPVSFNNALTFTGDQTYGATTGSAANLGGNVTIASGTLTANANFYATTTTIATGATLNILNGGGGNLSGAGNLVIASPAANIKYPSGYNVYDGGAASTFSGNIAIQRGAVLQAGGNNPANALGSASLTIEDGGQLSLYVSPTTPSETATLTVPNAITMTGNGAGVDQMQQGAINAGMYDSAKNETAGTLTVNLSGVVTLTGDTKLSSVYATATTYNFTGTFNQNGHVLGAVATAQPTYGVTTVQVNGQTVAGGASNGTPAAPAAPKTPNTGFTMTTAHPMQTLLVTVVGASAIAAAAFKSRKSMARR